MSKATNFLRVPLRVAGVLAGLGAVAAGLAPGVAAPVGFSYPDQPVAVGTGAVSWEPARVTRVVDGDTYVLLAGAGTFRLRLLGVDAPEHDQAFGAPAADSVARLLPPGRLVLVARAGLDLYGRTLGAVRLPVSTVSAAGRAVPLDSLLVARGWAWAFDPNRAVAGRAREQAAAQRAGLGLWRCGTLGPVPPKLWRSFNAQIKRRYRGACTW